MSPSILEVSTETNVSSLRSAILEEIEKFDSDLFDERDVSRIIHDDFYLRRFILQNGSEEAAFKAAIETLKWRKKFMVNDIRAVDINEKLIEGGSIFAHNRDKDGCRLLVISVHKYEKRLFDFTDVKRILSYWLDRLEREEYGRKITMFFDLSEATSENVDFQLARHLLKVFKFYHPWMTSKIILYDMPWIIQAVWKIIYSWLPTSSAEKIRFADRKTVLDYIDRDQLLKRWGGTDDYEYRFTEEIPGNPTPWLNT